jgi:hypothetical protein
MSCPKRSNPHKSISRYVVKTCISRSQHRLLLHTIHYNIQVFQNSLIGPLRSREKCQKNSIFFSFEGQKIQNFLFLFGNYKNEVLILRKVTLVRKLGFLLFHLQDVTVNILGYRISFGKHHSSLTIPSEPGNTI